GIHDERELVGVGHHDLLEAAGVEPAREGGLAVADLHARRAVLEAAALLAELTLGGAPGLLHAAAAVPPVVLAERGLLVEADGADLEGALELRRDLGLDLDAVRGLGLDDLGLGLGLALLGLLLGLGVLALGLLALDDLDLVGLLLGALGGLAGEAREDRVRG